MKHLRYASYVARHKFFVFVAGLRTGAPLWRLVIHDWSKMTPAEWHPYVEAFYGEKLHHEYDALLRAERQTNFDAAWLHHQHRNPHHWQHWLLQEDDGGLKVLEMPDDLIREMVADWMGAGRTITGKWEVNAWYDANAYKIKLGPETQAKVESLLELIER
jgi:hypothetical protein